MVEYQKIFLEERKILLPYFVKFKEDNTILLKEYLENCTVGDSNQWTIIMITYDKNIFSINNNCQKVLTFERHRILCPKKKERGIIVSDFFLL